MLTGFDLKVARMRAGLSQGEVCRRLGISRTTLWARYERPAQVAPELAVAYLNALVTQDASSEGQGWSSSATSTTGSSAGSSGSGSVTPVA